MSKLEKLREIANTIPRAVSTPWTSDYTESISRLNLYINGANVLIEHIDALLDVVEEAKTMRFYCLGSDASTENMLRRYDAAIAKLEAVE